VNRDLVRKVDLLLGNEEDFSAMLGVKLKGVSEDFASCRLPRMRRCCAKWLPLSQPEADRQHAAHRFDGQPQCVGRHCALRGQDCARAAARDRHFDRVGGGDSFASGLIYGLLAGKPIDWALRCGVAHGALAMTTPGDTSMATLAEVERLIKGGSARISR
jgi:2-dehydro-3-deoxygluconokinase